MDLYSGLPYWIAKNPMENYFNPLLTDITTDIVIIGTGITGSLVAHELCNAGISCIMVDRQSISSGSSIASTALLQYEIDTPLTELIEKIGEKNAAMAYAACSKSVDDIENVFKSIDYNPDFERVPSVFYASNRKGADLIEKEYAIRKKLDLPVKLLNKKELEEKYGIKARCALENNSSAQMDPYAGATHLINYHMEKHQLQVYTHTMVERCEEIPSGYLLVTNRSNIIQCKYVIIAAGFAAGRFLPEKVIQQTSLTATYAIISQPLDPKYLWHNRSLIWETNNPYLYIRTSNNRIIVGGENIEFKDPVLRDKLLRQKVNRLEKKFRKLYPNIPFVTEMAWCGTFSTSKNEFPFIGNQPGKERMFFALGYGGNGIIFSMIAAQIIKNKLLGISDEREKLFVKEVE
ncbi:FAD-binding oxidoreductase [Bacteroides sp. 519]|uniref:NAD(P)/FAD-dependent oxidoreductase n=1 Tax=Bacteroides sp. 519 TaxID=2302937 RepID=UPI0013D16C51|nr:FAD-dependent oxidoreductase [Bacteroides sp. 519]NDV58272.1 FAD-binding oxidoreductase [Bacteroides sp. 519]